jgi:hypothetical protein
MTEVRKAPPDAARKKGWYTINVSLGNDNEDKYVFVGGCEEGDFRIMRGKNVDVPKSVLSRLDDAVLGVAEQDESDQNKINTVERKRFPYTIVAVL